MKHRKVLEIAFLFALGFALFWPSRDAPYYYDDYYNFVQNERLLQALTWSDVFQNGRQETRPIYNASLWLQHRVFGLNSTAAHLGNVALHSINSAILYLVLLKPFAAPPLAFLSAVIFLVHPLSVESVVYFNSRSGLLGLFFGLLGILFFFSERRGMRFLGLIFLCAGFASKEDALFSVFWILLIALWRKKNDLPTPPRRWIWAAAASPLFLAVIYTFLHSPHLGNVGESVEPPLYYLWKQGVYIPLHLSEFLIPWPLSVDRELPGWMLSNFTIASGWIALVSLMAFIWLAFRKIPALGLALALAAMVPTHSLIPFKYPHSVRILYPMLAGLSLATAAWIQPLSQSRKLKAACAVFLVSGMATLTRVHMSYWIDPVRFWERDTRYAPRHFRAWINLAVEYGERKRWDEAANAIEKAVNLAPKQPSVWYNSAVIWGTRTDSKQNKNRALLDLEKLLKLAPEHIRGQRLAEVLKKSREHDPGR
jgi:protein O-mannosyl-transferase